MEQLVSQILAWIPVGATRVSLLGRHSLSVQIGPNDSRTLSPKGIKLCHEVSDFYNRLVRELEIRFGGSAVCFRSEMARSFSTVWEILNPDHIICDPRLNLLASLKKIQGGEWYRRRKIAGRSDVAIISDFLAADLSVGEDQPFGENALNYREWATELDNDTRVRITFAHEVACSLAAHPYLDSDVEPGLSECQAYLFCVDDAGNVLHVIKVTPPATL
ncbi:MAG: hypothetical protein WC693_04670 [Patescibacteria group bacterium]|jgi:hypothetical protein